MEALQNRWDQEMSRFHRRNADISVYRDFVARYDGLISGPEVVKNNAEAVRHRSAGNRAYLEKRFDDALLQYNRSICFAENQSEHLGIGYANRSAIYYEIGEYEFALYNIDLAMKHNYPERLMPKLLARETTCKERIASGHSKGTVPDGVVNINVEVNPKIPFLANGIGMQQFEGMGRGLVAKRGFKTGDVILDEQINFCYVSYGRTHRNCSHCGSVFSYCLIPCPSCIAVMYCGEKCRKEDLRVAHRFECSVVTKLWSVAHTNMMMMAKLFFYGLTAYKDNINKMMKFCLSNADVGSNPLDLDLTSPNPLGIFKAFHRAKPYRNPTLEHHLKLSAAAFFLVFMQDSLVQSIIRTDAQRNFMLRCMLVHGFVTSSLVLNRVDKHDGWRAVLSPVACLLNHSHDPNVTTEIVTGGKIRVIVLRPIQSGDQILSSYTPAWWNSADKSKLDFLCECVVCDRGPAGAKWHQDLNREHKISAKARRGIIQTRAFSSELIEFQHIVQITARDGLHPGKLFGDTLKLYYDLLDDEIRREDAKANRARALQRD